MIRFYRLHWFYIDWFVSSNIYSDTESLKLLQMVVEGLDIREHTHGVWLVPHLHHVIHLDQTEAVRLLSGTGRLNDYRSEDA